MADLSQRFAELMARLARSDADLFRTLGEQNMAVRRMVEEVLPNDAAAPAVAPAPVLSIEECSQSRLKARFRTLGPARAFLEQKVGPPPSGLGRIGWAVVEQTFRRGSWPAGKATSGGRAGGDAARAAMEQRLGERFDRMEARLDQIELLLLQALETRLGPTLPPS